MSNKPPNTIYLQWYGDNVYGDSDAYGEPGEVTWCADEVNDSDIKYLYSTPRREHAGLLYFMLRRVVEMRGTMAPEIQREVINEARKLIANIEEEEKLL